MQQPTRLHVGMLTACWNELSKYTRSLNAISLSSFKRRLVKFDASKF